MAKLTLVNKAQKNIYQRGKSVSYVSQKGKRQGQTLTKLDRTVPADEKDAIFIAKGEPYYWWQHKNSPKQFSKTKPKRSQLTRSAFLAWLYDTQDKIGELSCETMSDLDSRMDELKSSVEEWRDVCEENKNNMPEALQDGEAGELLQQRYDSLDDFINELDGMEYSCEEDEDSWKEEWRSENEKGDGDNENEGDQEYEDRCQQAWNEYEQEQVDSLIEEIQNFSLEG